MMNCSTGLRAWLALACFLVSSPALALVYAGHVDTGLATDVEIVGTTAYVSEGTLTLYDVSDPDAPALALSTVIAASDVEVAGNRAYALGGGTLTVLDVTNPAAPAVLGTTSVDGTYLAVEGGLAFASAALSLSIVDVSNPSAPSPVGSFANPFFPPFPFPPLEDVAVSGTTAYLGVGGVVIVVDVSSPAAPTEVLQVVASVPTGDLEVRNDALWIVGGSSLQIFDISTPTNPVATPFSTSFGLLSDVEFDGDLAIVVGDSAGANGVSVLDATDPLNPVLLPGRLSVPLVPTASFLVGILGASGVALSGGTAYLVQDALVPGPTSARLQVLDVQNTDFPTVVGALTGLGVADIEMEANLAYLPGNGGGLSVVDSSDPADPQVVGMLSATGDAREVVVRGSVAYVVLADVSPSCMAPCGGIRVVDVSNPASPAEVIFIPTTPRLFAVELLGDHLVIGAEGSVDVYSLANPLLPVSIGSIPVSLTSSIFDLEVSPSSGDVYASTFDDGVRIVSLSNPSAPTLLGDLPSSTGAFDTAVEGDRAYVGGAGFLKIFDVSLPASAVELSSISYNATFSDVEVQSERVYASTGFAAYVYDVADPLMPILLGGTSVGRDLELGGSLVFGAGLGAFAIADYGPEYVPEPGAIAMLGCGSAMVFALSSRRRRDRGA